jgi:hypothetical protein
MASRLESKVLERLDGSVLVTDPFPFVYADNFFPEDYYKRVESIFPTDEYLTPINSKEYKTLDTQVDNRLTLSIYSRMNGYGDIDNYPYRRECIAMRRWFRDFLIPALANKLQIQLPEVWDDDTRFVLDLPGYIKRPHTDIPQKIFSVLIYMSNSSSGTTILRPKQSGFSDDYGYDHRFDEFETVFDPPFKPNSLIALARTDTSFHCVKKLGPGEYRKAIHINIRT